MAGWRQNCPFSTKRKLILSKAMNEFDLCCTIEKMITLIYLTFQKQRKLILSKAMNEFDLCCTMEKMITLIYLTFQKQIMAQQIMFHNSN